MLRSTGLALVLVDGSDGLEYDRATLTGELAAGGHLAIAIEAQNGAPDGVALVWFHIAKEADWRIDSPAASADAFESALAARR